MNITLCNGKGGTGKTTLTVLLAHALAAAGKSVAVLDRDPHGTARNWIENLDETGVELHKADVDYDVVFIDTPPSLSATQVSTSIKQSDVMVVVSSPSPADLWTSRDTANVVKKFMKKGGKIRILFNNVQSNTLLSRDLTGMAEQIGLKPFKTIIRRRQCYQHAALLGWKALSSDAREEMFKAALEIITG